MNKNKGFIETAAVFLIAVLLAGGAVAAGRTLKNRLGSGGQVVPTSGSAVTSVTNDTNVTGSIASNNLTLGWTGTLDEARGGLGGDFSGSTGTLTISGGTVSATTFPINSIITSNASGALQATTSQLTVGSILSTTTAVSSFVGNVGVGSTTPRQHFGVQGNLLISGDMTYASSTATGTVTAANVTAVTTLSTQNLVVSGTCSGSGFPSGCGGGSSTSNASTTISTFTAGNTIAVNDPVFIATSTTGTWVASTTMLAEDSALHWGRATFNNYQGTEAAQQIQATTSLVFNTVVAKVSTTGSPGDNVILTIQRDDGSNAPNGTTIASTTVAGSALPTTSDFYSFTLDKPVNINSGDTIWVKFDRSGSDSDVNYYIAGIRTGNPYPATGNGATKVFHTGAWQADGSRDWIIGLFLNTTADRVYMASAAASTTANTYLGIAKTGAVSGGSINVHTGGYLDGLTSTTTATQLYLSNVPGQFSNIRGSSTVQTIRTLTGTTGILNPY